MKNLIQFSFVLLSFIGFTNLISAQVDFGIHGGASLPSGEFAAEEYLEEEDEGGAGVGFNVGVEILYPLPTVDGLGLFAGADFLYNPLKGDAQTDVEDFFDERYTNSFDFTFPNYTSIVIPAGLFYDIELDEGFTLTLKGGLNFNIFNASDFEAEADGVDGSFVLETESTNKVGLTLGAGLMFGDGFNINVTLLSMGQRKYDLQIDNEILPDFPESGDIEKDHKTDVITLTIGYRFQN